MTLRYVFFGILLSVSTAVGCIAYERVVKQWGAIAPTLNAFAMGLLMVFVMILLLKEPVVVRLDMFRDYNLWIYLASGITTPLWYFLTKKYSVAMGATWEVTYFVLLIALYVMFGTQKLTLNFIFGTLLVIAGVIFASM